MPIQKNVNKNKMKEETLIELLERRFVTADGVIIWDEQMKGLIDGAIKRASKNCTTEQTGESSSPDLSWMWHCAENPNNVLDYSALVADKDTIVALNKSALAGFRLALRRLEDLKLIQMGDIDRMPNDSDQHKWDEQKFDGE